MIYFIDKKKKKKEREGEGEEEGEGEVVEPELGEKRKKYPGLCLPDKTVEDPVMTKEEKESAQKAMNEVNGREGENNILLYCISQNFHRL